MLTANIYLNFLGNCEEAFNFYQSVLGGELEDLTRFSEMPPQEGMPPLSEEMANQIMHVSLPISKETFLMGSDTGGEWAPKFIQGNNFSISLKTNDKSEADRLFHGLSVEGQITMPMGDTFWDAYFGMFTDKFGINWMISAE
ncbi:VOC family protein [Rhodonellum sp.]|uniref:VOC family protein n=1 Tax=Rhodonellum sp. TaxID=2231180 RepID=UPI002715D5E6|nr:VOC family protein [Rhodonellum sp.]MDO9552971.1 VOC family protein [Rhodonellum sp.]